MVLHTDRAVATRYCNQHHGAGPASRPRTDTPLTLLLLLGFLSLPADVTEQDKEEDHGSHGRCHRQHRHRTRLHVHLASSNSEAVSGRQQTEYLDTHNL